MARAQWDRVGQRTYEAGVDRGMLYAPGLMGVPWNGLISVNEQPVGGGSTPYYIDGVKYLEEVALDEFAATIVAFTYPEQFLPFEGIQGFGNGLYSDNQPRRSFGMSYRTGLGDDLKGMDRGYKIHLVYNAKVTTTTKDRQSHTSQIDPLNFSWPIVTTPVQLANRRGTSHLIIDSTKTDKLLLAALEDRIYGKVGKNAYLPTPSDLINLFETYQPSGYGYGPYGHTTYGHGSEY